MTTTDDPSVDSADSSSETSMRRSFDDDDFPESSSTTHPYVTMRTLSKSKYEADKAFVSAMFERPRSGAASANGAGSPLPAHQTLEPSITPAGLMPSTPRSILMSQKLGQAHADAILTQLSPRSGPSLVEARNMPAFTLDPGKRNMSTLTCDEDEAFSEKLLDDSVELRRIGDALAKCMALRDKYMDISCQHEADNPINKPGWKIYPKPPPPAWRNFNEPATDVQEEFDMSKCKIPQADDCVFEMVESGVFAVFETQKAKDEGREPFTKVPSIKEYYMDLDFVLDTISDGPIKTWAFRRLRYLDARWQLYVLLNEREETMQSKMVPHRDLYNVRKVDGHVHLASAMNQKHLLRFIKYKLKTEPDRPVIVFESLNLTAYDLSIDTLDMHAHNGAYHRFDKFNLKYNPIGRTDNFIDGEYFAQITKEVMSDLEQSKYQMAEYRISIYGRSIDEWDKLAAWVVDHKLFSNNVRWLIQTPRLYNVYKAGGQVENFEQVLRNIFQPLFEVTKDPSSHPKLHVFLQRVVGFDTVDDESKPERRMHKKYPLPCVWDSESNPPYTYYCYFTMANLCSLNQWRMRRGFNTFVFRPHAGEAGDTEHLSAAFLTAQAINHGILLRKVPALQYLYYMQQIGLAMSPLSNNALFLVYERSPFNTYFQRGLNVALSTDDPLQFHFTKEPLIEEYSIAAQIWKFNSVDIGFEAEVKRHWIGRDYLETGQTEVHKTNVPLCRLKYRASTLEQEHAVLARMTSSGSDSLELDPVA
ncbi:AMP deaminase [Linderina pennispora]|uniref:AMP deaminase n=1 Tax=Linderina pennispora TaxID=61395 RepID=A0A1Y1W537_9FUNG|nr:AMP deaminase [Linderina pennispora]ORX68326.1 AMP deaminase [Linderina pennispora]